MYRKTHRVGFIAKAKSAPTSADRARNSRGLYPYDVFDPRDSQNLTKTVLSLCDSAIPCSSIDRLVDGHVDEVEVLERKFKMFLDEATVSDDIVIDEDDAVSTTLKRLGKSGKTLMDTNDPKFFEMKKKVITGLIKKAEKKRGKARGKSDDPKEVAMARLSSDERVKLVAHLERNEKIFRDDMEHLRKLGIVHNPVTTIGRSIKLFKILEDAIRGDKSREYKEAVSRDIYLRFLEDDLHPLMTDPRFVDKSRYIEWLMNVVHETDMCKFQMVEKYHLMKPLNKMGFYSLDEWQKDAVRKMREGKNLLLCIPTSGGKTFLSSYLTKMGKVLFVCPNVPLARQVTAYLTRLIGEAIPFITDDFRSHFYRDEVLVAVKKAHVIVVTPDAYLNLLPIVGTELFAGGTVVLDEIHLMNDSAEMLAILHNTSKTVGLSATVSNPDDIVEWQSNMGKEMDVISSKDRFFNLGASVWDGEKKELVPVNPLALVDFDDIVSGDILTKDLEPTPPDVYNLAVELEKNFDLGALSLKNRFPDVSTKKMDLNDVLAYYSELIEWMVNVAKDVDNVEKLRRIFSSFEPTIVSETTSNIVDVMMKLKDTAEVPALIMVKNSEDAMKLAKGALKIIDDREHDEYPDRYASYLRKKKEIDSRKKKLEKLGLGGEIKAVGKGASKEDKAKMAKLERQTKRALTGKIPTGKRHVDHRSGCVDTYDETAGVLGKDDMIDDDDVSLEHFQTPTDKFTFTQSRMAEAKIMSYTTSLKKYFPSTDGGLHPVIIALWRGIGIYAKGLPEDYLVLIQSLAMNKQLNIVFADESFLVGVSMPFKTVVIYTDETIEDNMTPGMVKQGRGRAGRRGIDTKGNLIMVGYSWHRVKELLVSEVEKVIGSPDIESIYLPVAQKLADISGNDIDFKSVLKHNMNRLKADADEMASVDETWNMYSEIMASIVPDAMAGDVEMLQMLWSSRNFSCDGICYANLVPILESHFSGGDIGDVRQIKGAHILSMFIQTERATRSSHILPLSDIWESKLEPLHSRLIEAGIPIVEHDKIDGRIYKSIQENRLFVCSSQEESEKFRNRFIKFMRSLIVFQNYLYYDGKHTICRIFGKLITRCKWIMWNSSPLHTFVKKDEYVEDTSEELVYDDDEDDGEDDE